MIRPSLHRWTLAIALALTAAVYWPGLSGGWLFDDYPNIVDNPGVQPHVVSVSALTLAALSSPASEFKRPLASLSFAASYLASGLNPWSWKLFNLVVHLLNGALVFLLAKMLLAAQSSSYPRQAIDGDRQRANVIAALIASGWMLLPINLTAVLYVVQREESMANLFVLIGLIGYTAGRQRMLRDSGATNRSLPSPSCSRDGEQEPLPPFTARRRGEGWSGFWLCTTSLILPTAIGLLAKETAVMLPLYAFLIEWIVLRLNRPTDATVGKDRRIVALFVLVLLLPMILGLIWLAPSVLNSSSWATRNFSLSTRLLSEARIVMDYITWTLLPTPHALSFYHDQYPISTGLLSPWTTLASIVALTALVSLAAWLRNRRPLVTLGIALFLGCQLLTSTVLPLELIYEHRNYFASFGLMLALVPLLCVPSRCPLALPRHVLLGGLLLLWTGETAITASAWGNPLTLAETLAARAPDSPRAQYELGRTYIIYSHYDPASPFTNLAYAPLERAAALPNASILPEQALIFMNAHMHLSIKDRWWDSLIAKLKARKPGIQDESSLGALTQCARDGQCELPKQRMVDAFLAALSHPHASARLQAIYGDYAWNMLDDHALGLRMIKGAVKAASSEPAYRTTLIRMLAASGHTDEARKALQQLQGLNIGGRLDTNITSLHALIDNQQQPSARSTSSKQLPSTATVHK